MPQWFKDEEAMYSNVEEARTAGEVDFGSGWRGKDVGPTYRVSWNEASKDVWAVRSSDGRLLLLGHASTVEELEEAVAGWASWCGSNAPYGENSGMRWLIERLDEANLLLPDPPGPPQDAP